DQLTGAYNRHFFEEYMQKELSRCKREKYPLSVTMIDVDRFKEINDLYGHVFGDEVLRMIVHTIKRNVRASDVVVRYGGDEFIVVLPHASLQDAQAVMKRIKVKLRGSQILGEPFPLSISYGICVFDGQKELPQLLQEIDRAMYSMKREGKR
ncbi:MAG: GGDEF domain-containing protein, partial [Candidatus Atribacteria bacterium]|nr:GGDEF domain-containing protein [Candidatus Atribacteria bacterium]MCD6350296.1 GGDEF domain-containing protein [Candidatus Atribacteria bacterium]